MDHNWHGVLKILWAEQVRAGRVLWRAENLNNTLHVLGEQFFLQALFLGGTIPTYYYLGLDNRSTISVNDTIGNLLDEPSGKGYLRQRLSSSAGWNVEQVSDGHGGQVFRAIGDIITFQASGGSWGPVNNLFMTTTSDNSGVLLATDLLPGPTTLNDGDAVNMRFSLSLRDYPF